MILKNLQQLCLLAVPKDCSGCSKPQRQGETELSKSKNKSKRKNEKKNEE